MCLTLGVLTFGFGMAKPSLAITGCTNMYLNGAYNSQISNIALQSAINMVNPLPSSGATGLAALPGGLGGNPSSISGNVPGLGRFFFDGIGNIYGTAAGSDMDAPTSTAVGTYSVSSDCTATIALNTGQNYSAILVDQGREVFFLQTDVSGNGALGLLQRSVNSCVASQYPQSFGFQLSGASSSTSGSGGPAPAPTTTLVPYSVIGVLSLDGNGSFTVTQYQFGNGDQPLTGSGTYTVGTNCVLSLSYTSPSAGTMGTLTPPASVATLLGTTSVNNNGAASGLITIQPVNGQLISGFVISQ